MEADATSTRSGSGGPRTGTIVRRLAVALVSVASVSAGVVAGATGLSGSEAAAASSSVTLGAYVGAADPSGVSSFASTTGAHVSVAVDYLPDATKSGQSWAQAWSPGALSWQLPVWADSPYHLALGVPIIMRSSTGAPLGTLAGGADGAYDADYTTLAQTLVADGEAGAYLRLGWEFNVTAEYAWSDTDSSTSADATDYVDFFRNIVTTMRAVPGADFKFVWNPGIDQWGNDIPVSDYYPGNAYVDDIGLDVYDQSYVSTCGPGLHNSSTPAESQCVWDNDLLVGASGAGQGLNYFSYMSAETGKPLVIPEWGVTVNPDDSGLGDDPTFMTNFIDWMSENHVVWNSYFDFGNALLTKYPDSLAVYRQAYGATFSIDTTSLPSAAPGYAYSVQLSADGGATPYKWTIVPGSGRPPRGLRLHSNGVLSGKPRAKDAPGSYTFTVQASAHASKGQPAERTSQRLTLTVP
jgi:hypothetical protein